MPVLTRGYVLNNSAGAAANLITLDPTTATSGSSVQPGDQVFAVVVANAASGNTWEPPAGWTDVQPAWALIGTFSVKVYHRTWQPGDTAPSFSLTGTARWLQGCAVWLSGAGAPEVVGTPKGRTDTPAETVTCTAPGVTTASVGHVLAFAFERTSATETGESITVTGADKLFTLPQSGSNLISTVTVATREVAEAGPVGSVTTSYPNSQATNGWAFQVAVPALVTSDTSDAPFALTLKANAIAASTATEQIDLYWANAPFYAAHRTGGANWPELTLYGLQQCLAWGVKAVELSVWKTADDVWVCHHDHNTARMTGANINIYDATWAELSGLTTTAEFTDDPGQPRRPIMRLDTALDALPPNVIAYIDDKTTMNVGSLLDLLDTYPNARGRFVFKQFMAQWAQADAARARGYRTWGIYYDAEIVTAPTRTGSFDTLGMNFNATQEHWNAALATGKPVMGHIILNPSQKTSAQSKGASGFMVSSVKTVIPRATTEADAPFALYLGLVAAGGASTAEAVAPFELILTAVGASDTVGGGTARDITITAEIVPRWEAQVMKNLNGIVAGSVDYIDVQVVADVAMASQPVEIGVGKTAADATWQTASWQGGSATTRTARILLNTTGMDPSSNPYRVYVRVTDLSEKPLRLAGTFNLVA